MRTSVLAGVCAGAWVGLALLLLLASQSVPSVLECSSGKNDAKHKCTALYGGDGHFSPLLPPAIPLAVKSPYLNAWLSTGGREGSRGMLAGTWPKFWPVRYPPTERQYELRWQGLIKIDDDTFQFMGNALDQNALSNVQNARQTAFEYTATRSTFFFKASNVSFAVEFLSPVTPHDYVRMSLPLSYMSVKVDPRALKHHNVAIYTDIAGDWASGDARAELASLLILTLRTWDFVVHKGAGVHDVRRKDELVFSEFEQQAEWGSAVYATEMASQGPGVVAGSGPDKDVRSEFVKHGHLKGYQDVDYRSARDRSPVFAFSKRLTTNSATATFTIGHMRSPYVNYVTKDGQKTRQGYWSTKFHSKRDAISFWLQDYKSAAGEADKVDKQVRKDAERVANKEYAAIAELSTRQAFATFEVTVGDNEDDIMAFLKEISSNGDMSTVDVIFPLYPILQYMNPTLIALLLEPLLQYSVSGLYPNRWTVHDLGTYPNATGYNGGNDEPMPVEEAGNMLWMMLAYWQVTKDTQWIEKYYPILTQWTTFLIEDGLVPAEQLSTDDFAGTLSNQTNLAVKAIVGIGAMGKLAEATGKWVQSVHYKATAQAYVKEWTKLALTKGSAKTRPHAKLSYQDEDSHGLLYNLFGDRVLNLGLFDDKLYEWQTDWYRTRKNAYGVPLDSRHEWTKTDWEMFAAASTTDADTRDMFVSLIVKYLQANQVDAGFPDLYETDSAKFPGQDNPDWNIEFIARPVVGGHFALLALDVANQANGVTHTPFASRRFRSWPKFVDQSKSTALRYSKDD
ncbi:hypothetical protein OIV83_006169 [Microbotryomycetes sp. JL201]|nr:hypothetical protein OIV83_006169 [Microbotryomycetes sp. JL201]